MSENRKETVKWSKYADKYDPIQIGSIDGTDTFPHDNGIVRAINSHYKPNLFVRGEARRTIFIGRLHSKTGEEILKRKFRRYGEIVRCRLIRDIVTGISKNYAFIEFESSTSAKAAVNEMNLQRIDNNEIIVDLEHERQLDGWKPRRLGGGFGGKKESGQLRFGCKIRPFQRPFGSSKSTTTKDLKEIFRHQKYNK